MKGSLTVSLALLALAVLAGPAPAGAVTPDVAIANLNAQRAANGIPAGITIDPALSQGCVAHDNYMHLNGELTHDEVDGKPGYSREGQQAGQTSVLALGAPPWTSPTTNPWGLAPIHLGLLLAPPLP